VLVSTTSTDSLFRREGAATQNAGLASSVRVLGTIRRGVPEGRSSFPKLQMFENIKMFKLCNLY